MIAEETIDRVRQQAAIAAVVEQTVRLQRRGRSLVGLCPFHKEKTPSFHVNPERGFYHCFGCGASGDAIRFVQEMEGLSFLEAVRQLADRFGIDIVETGNDTDRRQQAESRRQRQDLYDANQAAAAFFERQMREHPLGAMAAEELGRRGLVSHSPTDAVADALQAFRIGYAPYGWDGLARHLRDTGMPVAPAEAVGLLVPRKTSAGHYDRFRHRLMFAVLDMQGRVIAFSGRALPSPDPAVLASHQLPSLGEPAEGEAPAKYLNSPESPIYRKRETLFGLYQARAAIRETGRVVLVEGNFDVVSLYARGIRHVVAPLGTSFTADQARAMRRLAGLAIIMFDGDAAGKKAVLAAREPMKEAGLAARVAMLPDGADPDDVIRTKGPEAILRALHAARGLLEHLIDATLDTGFRAQDAVQRAERIKEVTALLASEDDPEVRMMARSYADTIAERLGIADAPTLHAVAERVRRSLGRNAAESETARVVPKQQVRSADRREDIGLSILGAIFDHPELLDSPELWENANALVGDMALALMVIRQSAAAGPAATTEQFLAKLPQSIHSFAASRLAAPRYEQLEDARTVLLQNLGKLKRLEQLRRKNEAMVELGRAAATGDYEAEIALLREQDSQARQRHGVGER